MNAKNLLQQFWYFQSEVVCTDDPDRSLTYRKQAEYFCSVEKWEAAVDCYKKAIELDNREDILSICLSRALLNSGRYNEALLIIEQVLNLVIWMDILVQTQRGFDSFRILISLRLWLSRLTVCINTPGSVRYQLHKYSISFQGLNMLWCTTDGRSGWPPTKIQNWPKK